MSLATLSAFERLFDRSAAVYLIGLGFILTVATAALGA